MEYESPPPPKAEEGGLPVGWVVWAYLAEGISLSTSRR